MYLSLWNCIVYVIVHVSINCVTKFFPPQGLVAGTVIGTLILGKIVWHYGKSGWAEILMI